MIDVADCMEFRQALRMGTPRLVHGTVILLVLFLGTALVWMSLTRANLIVYAIGRVRPITGLEATTDDFSEDISCEIGGRVVAVQVKEGDEVKKGDILLRLDTQRLDNEISRLQRKIDAGAEELAKLERFEHLLARQHAAAISRAQAQLAEGTEGVRLAKERQAGEVRLATLTLADLEDKAARARNLAARGVIAPQELVDTLTRTKEAREKLHQAQLPVDEGRTRVLERALEFVARENEVQKHELDVKRRTRQAEVEADRLELRNLELDRQQAAVRAPADGMVTLVQVKAGDLIAPGKVGITTVPQHGLELVMQVPNQDVGRLRVGMPARIKLDAYDYQQYGVLHGKLRFVAPDSAVNQDTVTNHRALYTVKVALDQETFGQGKHRAHVKLGMTGLAEIVTDQESFLLLLLRRIGQSISLR
jgi:HlyD family secretion protein